MVNNFTPNRISFLEFKNLVQAALTSWFETSAITRGDKAFDIHANTYRIDADVVPTFSYHYYPYDTLQYEPGFAFLTDSGKRIYNYPEQAYRNGVILNDNTGRRYKRMVRILKRIRMFMQEDKIAAAENIASFLIESLLWNVPANYFNHPNYTDDLRFSVLIL